MAQGGGGGGEWSRFESALRASLRLLRDRWAERGRLPGQARGVPASAESPPTPFSALEALPADVLLYIMSFLEPRDLSHLGSTNRYLRVTVQDPLLWRYLILRDLQSWHTIDWKSLPDAKIFNRSFAELNDNGTYDYMEVDRIRTQLSFEWPEIQHSNTVFKNEKRETPSKRKRHQSRQQDVQ